MTNEIRFYRSNGQHGFLSNLFKRTMFFEERFFSCSEEAYQYGKPKDKAVAEWLILAPRPHLCAAAAHSLLAFDIVPNWNEIKVDRMRKVLKAKFTQHRDFALLLKETGDAILVEESNTDAFWGIGKKGNGKNMLGVLLMELRQEITDHPAYVSIEREVESAP